jgi:hypothetical protein
VDLLLGDIDLHGRRQEPPHLRQGADRGQVAPVRAVLLVLPVLARCLASAGLLEFRRLPVGKLHMQAARQSDRPASAQDEMFYF